MQTEHLFARDEVLPSWWANALGSFLSESAHNLVLYRADATHVGVSAPAADAPGGEAAAIIAVQGRWRWIEAAITRAHPGGAAGNYDVYVTAKDTDIQGAPAPYTDDTDYAFDLAIVAAGGAPAIVAGTVDVIRKIGGLAWDGAAITRVWQTVPPIGPHSIQHAIGGSDPLSPADIGAVATGGDASVHSLLITGAGTALTVDHDAAIDGSLTVTGSSSLQATTIAGGLTLSATGGTAISGTQAAGNVLLSNKQAAADANASFTVLGSGLMRWGPGGGGAWDTNLYRSAAATLRTDSALAVGGGATVTGDVNVTGIYRVGGGQIAAANLVNGVTGTAGGRVVLQDSPALTGNPTAVTQAAGNNSTRLATTAYTDGAITAALGGGRAGTFTTVTATGLITGQAGLTLDAGAGTVGQVLTLTGRNAGAAASNTIAAGTLGGLNSTVPAAKLHVWTIGAATAATLSNASLDIAGGSKYTIGGVQIAAPDLSNGVTGNGAVVLKDSATLTGNLTLSGHTLTAGAVTFNSYVYAPNGMRIGAGGAPAYPLDVTGDVNASGALRIGGASINTAGTLANVAYLNAAQTFAAATTFSANVYAENRLRVGSAAAPAWALDVTGNVNTDTGYLIGGANINTAGVLPNVAYHNAANVFTQTQTIDAPLVITQGAGNAVTLNNSGAANAILVNHTSTSHAIRVNVPTPEGRTWSNNSFVSQVVNDSAAPYNFNHFSAQSGNGSATLGQVFFVDAFGGVHNASGVYTSISDRALKTEVEPLTGALETVLALGPSRFKWKKHKVNTHRVGKTGYGLVAQDVEGVLPHLVGDYEVYEHDADEQETLRGVNYYGLIPFLVGAVQELAAKVEALS